MGARRFGPDTARFLQRDNFQGATADLGLALDPLTQNRYALASGNPISFVEWDGHVDRSAGDRRGLGRRYHRGTVLVVPERRAQVDGSSTGSKRAR